MEEGEARCWFEGRRRRWDNAGDILCTLLESESAGDRLRFSSGRTEDRLRIMLKQPFAPRTEARLTLSEEGPPPAGCQAKLTASAQQPM